MPTTILESADEEEKTTIMKNNTGSLGGHNVKSFTEESNFCDNLIKAELYNTEELPQ